MKVITRQLIANGLAAHFKQWEAGATEYVEMQAKRGKRSLAEQLAELGPTPDPDICDAVIGKYMWGDLRKGATWTAVPACDECGKEVPCVVQVGEEPDYESATATLCIPCLQSAVKLADAVRYPGGP